MSKLAVAALTVLLLTGLSIAQGPAGGDKAVARWTEQLHDKDPDRRFAAAAALRRLGPAAAPATAELAKLLRDGDRPVRAEAAAALGAIGPRAKAAAPALAAALADRDGAVSRAAANALAAVGQTTSEVVTALCQSLEEADVSTRRQTVWAIAELDLEGEEVVAALAAALKDPDAEVRHLAASTLARLGKRASAVAPALAAALKDKAREVRRTAVIALGLVAQDRDSARAAVEALLNDRDSAVRLAAVYAGIRLGGTFEKAQPIFAELLRDGDAVVRGDAATALGDLGARARSAIPLLEAVLFGREEKDAKGKAVKVPRDPDPAVRRLAASALAEIDEARAEKAAPILVELMDHADSEVRGEAAWALGGIGGRAGFDAKVWESSESLKKGLARLMKALHDPSPFVRLKAAWGLGMVGPAAKAAADDLVKLQKEKDPRLALRAAQALEKVEGGPSDLRKLVVAAIQSDDATLRLDGLLTLDAELLNDKEIAAAVRALLEDPSPRLRRLAARLLAAGQGEKKPNV